MPMSQEFKQRLFPRVKEIAAHYGTPFHIYDEAGILATGAALKEAFAGIDGFREYYAVKAEDKELYTKLLNEVKAADPNVLPDLLPEQKMEQAKAERMLAETDEVF